MTNALHAKGRPAEAIPFWAENPAYPAGTDPWSATPTVVDPAAGTRNAGHVPATQNPAQYENSVKKGLARYIDYLADMPVMNWSMPLNHDSNLSPGALTLSYVGGASGSGIQNFWSEYHQAWFVVGGNGSELYVGDATNLDKFTMPVKENFGAVDEANGKSIQCNSEVGATINIHRTNADLSSIGNVALPSLSGSTNQICSAIYVPFDDTPTGGRIILVGTDGTGTFTMNSNDSGATWNKIVVDAAVKHGNYRMAFRGGEIVIIPRGVTVTSRVWYSTDVGATWNVRTMPAIGGSMLDIAYSQEEDAYVIVHDAGSLVCFGSVTNGFANRAFPATTPSLSGWAVQSFCMSGSAMLMCFTKSLAERRYYMSWNLGLNMRVVGRPSQGASGVELASNPQGQFFAYSVIDVQQTLACAGIGATLRAE